MRSDTYSAAMARPRLNRLLVPLEKFFPDGRDPTAYCCVGDGDCMAPEIGDGDTVIASPAAPLVPGQPVIVWFRDGRQLLIKRLIATPDTPENPMVIATLNPYRQFRIPMRLVDRVHRIVGNLSAQEHDQAVGLQAQAVGAAVHPPNFIVDGRGGCLHLHN
jgi:hypothetical protein